VDAPPVVTTTDPVEYVNAGVVNYLNAAPLNWWIP
jgi:hypothetical protein